MDADLNPVVAAISNLADAEFHMLVGAGRELTIQKG